jgi:GDPmannose 4,6-dehydratase
VTEACQVLDIPITWRGNGTEEIGVNPETGDTIVVIDPRYFRPTEVDSLLGDASKAKQKLGWQTKTSFQDLVKEMVEEDLEIAERHDMIEKAGYKNRVTGRYT